MDNEALKADLRSPEFMAEVFAKRPAMYVEIREPSAEQWRLILDSMAFSAALAGVDRVVLTPEDREAMRREDLGQDKAELVALVAKMIAALREAPGQR